jgi:uroporphyrinogen decarboxylase
VWPKARCTLTSWGGAKHTQQLSVLKPMECEMMSFVGEALTELRKEVGNKSAVLGFIGSPWTLATYIVEGKSSRIYKNIKTMMYSDVRSFFFFLSVVCLSCVKNF